MDTYTFRSPYGDYSFSDKQIESNSYLNNEEKEILHGLAKYQSNTKPNKYPSKKYYEVTSDSTYGRRTLTKTPVEYEFEVDLSEKRWYETVSQFANRKAREYEKRNTVKVKEVKREKVTAERSIFEDGTEVTKWDKDISYYY